mmetsp:Transcript_29668/g.47558  ORF Transcript_29668/g.47558 Transcript_29668/m.47558 type:complete len:84 (-) Transcript_29668:348-599(-)
MMSAVTKGLSKATSASFPPSTRFNTERSWDFVSPLVNHSKSIFRPIAFIGSDTAQRASVKILKPDRRPQQHLAARPPSAYKKN